ncbi:MAG: chemotaxis response regulator protein-glutamate methylesterase [Verrucomicrobiota bacterium]
MRIGIVNDLPLAVEALRRLLAKQTEHQVIWVAYNGSEAVELCERNTPDLILMDLVMPVMNGVEATRRIMARCPCAILLVTVSVRENAGLVFEAMGNGALDAVDTPNLGNDVVQTGTSLLAKIDLMNRLLAVGNGPAKPLSPSMGDVAFSRKPKLVAIGASAGGPAALAYVLSRLPRNLPAAVVLIQHVDERYAPSLAEWLNQQSILPVRAAVEGDTPTVGQVLLAVKNDHLVFTGPNRLGYTAHPQETFYRPSVDAFFESVARHYKGGVIGVVLTGMGPDGAKGLKTLRAAGCYTIAQDRETCAVYGMPKAAAAIGAAVDILPLEKIAAQVSERINKLA